MACLPGRCWQPLGGCFLAPQVPKIEPTPLEHHAHKRSDRRSWPRQEKTTLRSEPSASATLRHVVHGEQVVAHLQGQADVGDAPMLRAALDQMIAARKGVIIYLDDLDFIDVPLAGLLLQASQEAREHGRELRIANPKPSFAGC